MVTIVNPTPKPEALKYTDCYNCGIGLSYVRREIQSRRESFMGDTDIKYFIVCPGCEHECPVKSY